MNTLICFRKDNQLKCILYKVSFHISNFIILLASNQIIRQQIVIISLSATGKTMKNLVYNTKLEICLFSIRVFVHVPSQHKRAYITISDFQQNPEEVNQSINLSLKNIQPCNNTHQKQQDRQSIALCQKVKRLPPKRLQKGWIWYNEIFDFTLRIKDNNPITTLTELNLYTFDFNTGEKYNIARYKGPLYIDFSHQDQVKFTQFQMTEFNLGSEHCVANVEFKYCQKLDTNLKKIRDMTSKAYLQNALSPSKFVYDNSSFLSNTTIAQDRTNRSLGFSRTKDAKNSPLLNLNKLNRNLFVKSKFHSIFMSNKGMPIGREQRFPQPKKKLTDQLGYYVHKTLDINNLPTRERYKYASFGKDTKKCLKQDSFQCIGPGSARYRLPSIFDKY